MTINIPRSNYPLPFILHTGIYHTMGRSVGGGPTYLTLRSWEWKLELTDSYYFELGTIRKVLCRYENIIEFHDTRFSGKTYVDQELISKLFTNL